MKKSHKQIVNELKQKDISAWIKAVARATDIIHERYPMWCPCGKLATGLHTFHCQKFIKEVEKMAIQILTQMT